MKEHVCKKNPDPEEFFIYYERGHWLLEAGLKVDTPEEYYDILPVINYCPYCGKKLELFCCECDKPVKWYQLKIRDKRFPKQDPQHARCTRKAMRPIRWAVMRFRNGIRLKEEVINFSFKKRKDHE